jgi:hypothetical protein
MHEWTIESHFGPKLPSYDLFESHLPQACSCKQHKDLKMSSRFITRSILEWTKESGIVIASRVFEDHQTVRNCIDNTNFIKKYVRKAQLWPHKEIFGKDQVLRDVKLYVTDEYFTVKTTGAKDIITSE